MYQVDASDADTQFQHWLEAAEQGETIVIYRNGQPVARLVPDSAARHAKAAQALEAIRALRKTPKQQGQGRQGTP